MAGNSLRFDATSRKERSVAMLSDACYLCLGKTKYTNPLHMAFALRKCITQEPSVLNMKLHPTQVGLPDIEGSSFWVGTGPKKT